MIDDYNRAVIAGVMRDAINVWRGNADASRALELTTRALATQALGLYGDAAREKRDHFLRECGIDIPT